MTQPQTTDNVHVSWTFGPYSLSEDGNLRIGPTAIHLPPLQRRLLVALVRQNGQVLSRELLLEEVWGHTKVSEVSISRTVHGLRRIFTDGPLGPSVIRTIYGGGYRLDVPIRPVDADKAIIGPLHPGGFPTAHTLSAFVEGLVWVRQRDPRLLPKAEHHLRRCLLNAPDFTPAMVVLASTRLAQYQWGLLRAENIESELELLLQRAEDSGDMAAEVLALRVEVLSLMHWQPDLAEGRFAAWLPDQLPAGAPLHSWVRHLVATGRAAEALNLLEPHLNAENPDGWMLTAVASWFHGEHEKAIRYLREQLSIDASLAGARLILAHVLADGGRPTEALRELEILAIPADAPTGLEAFTALVLALCGKTSQASAALRRALADGTQAGVMTSMWGLTALALGDEAAAANLLELAVRNRCGLAPFVRHLPWLRLHAGSPALARFQAAMKNRFRCTF
ncbi:MAG: winged helix-turn-helix domain-containing protein [Cyanobacteriota bacterium]|nr:winged helix-turn-helix domain-containing protein [Cyanobacteriota bacterium]